MKIEWEEARLRAELETLNGQVPDPEELQKSLEEFDELWEELFPAERARMLGLLAERVEYEAMVGSVALKFKSQVRKDTNWSSELSSRRRDRQIL